MRRSEHPPAARGGAALVVLLGLAAGGCAGERPGAGAARDTAGPAPSESVPAERGDTVEAPSLTTLRVGGVEVRVEVADEPAERERGLMYRDSLPRNTGMLFVYPREQILSFWMRNTRIPLDIAFLDGRGRVVDIQRMEPRSERLHESAAPAMYALEMEAGWFEEHGVAVGDRVRF